MSAPLFLSTLSLRRATIVNAFHGDLLTFLSTLSLRRATLSISKTVRRIWHFYPRSPCGERPDMAVSYSKGIKISIHALLAESDFLLCRLSLQRSYFYPRSPCGERLFFVFGVSFICIFLSTLSLRRATVGANYHIRVRKGFLSTLSLRRATVIRKPATGRNNHFYPRSPCGERPIIQEITVLTVAFLSTLSLRRATAKVHKTVGHFCAYETNFMEIASSC